MVYIEPSKALHLMKCHYKFPSSFLWSNKCHVQTGTEAQRHSCNLRGFILALRQGANSTGTLTADLPIILGYANFKCFKMGSDFLIKQNELCTFFLPGYFSLRRGYHRVIKFVWDFKTHAEFGHLYPPMRYIFTFFVWVGEVITIT